MYISAGGIGGNPVVVKQELLQNPAAGLVMHTDRHTCIDVHTRVLVVTSHVQMYSDS